MPALRALIVDDEPLARRELARLLAACDDVEVTAEAGDLDSALAAAGDSAPAVVFLDVRLGRESGFALLPSLPPGTAVVFVTAFDDYAVRAFEVHALDYLLKPVEPRRLAETVQRLRAAREAAPGGGPPPKGPSPEVAATRALGLADWLFLERGRRGGFARVANVAAITAEGDYSRVHTIDGTSALVHRALADWVSCLPAASFARVHRSALVNLHHVLEVRGGMGATRLVTLRGLQRPVRMSRRAAAALRERLR